MTGFILLREGVSLITHRLEVFGVIVVGGAQMDAIVALCCFQGLLPLARGLVEIVQQVIALTALVQLLCIFLLEDRKQDRKVNAFGLESPVVSVRGQTRKRSRYLYTRVLFVLL